MRKLLRFALLTGLLLVGSLQAQTIQLRITLDASQLPNAACRLNQGAVANNRVYLHSGLCASTPQYCTDSICQPGSNIWQTVIGNWGLDDGVGLMNYDGNNTWSLTMIPTTYYNQPGATPYTIGLVFRNLDGTIEGKDDNCTDIFIKGIHTSTPTVVNCANVPFPAVTVERTILAGVNEPSYLGGLLLSPNPSNNIVNIDYALHKKASQFAVKIYSSLGQEVITLASGSQVPGSHRLVWDGKTAAGAKVENGLYYMVMTDGQQLIASEKILMMR